MSTAGNPPLGGSTTELSEQAIFDVLANQRRRHAVHTLKRHNHEPMELGELAEEIAAIENNIDVAELSYDQRKTVYTALQQSHLPKMDDAGVVEFDKDRGTIEPTPALEEVELYLEVVPEHDIPWSEYYLGLTGVAVALIAAAWIDAWPIGLLPDLGAAVLVTVAFGISAAVHTYLSRGMRLGTDDDPPGPT